MKEEYIKKINEEMKDFDVPQLRNIYAFCKGMKEGKADREKRENKEK